MGDIYITVFFCTHLLNWKFRIHICFVIRVLYLSSRFPRIISAIPSASYEGIGITRLSTGTGAWYLMQYVLLSYLREHRREVSERESDSSSTPTVP